MLDSDRPGAVQAANAHNFAVDRQFAEQMTALYLDVATAAWTNRAYLRRAVEHLVGADIRQFLDVGSGVPTVGHVHEIAQGVAPESRVVFIDIDPVAVAHGNHILADNNQAAAIQEDVRQPERILAAPQLRGLLDLNQPIAVLAVALLTSCPMRMALGASSPG